MTVEDGGCVSFLSLVCFYKAIESPLRDNAKPAFYEEPGFVYRRNLKIEWETAEPPSRDKSISRNILFCLKSTLVIRDVTSTFIAFNAFTEQAEIKHRRGL